MADKKFADYVKDLMAVLPTVGGNPMLSMTSEDARYREDPFYKSREIQARNKLELEEKEKEEELKRIEAENARLEAMSNASGYDSEGQGIDPSVAAYLDAENMGAKGGRNEAMMNVIGSIAAGYPVGDTSGWLGMTDSMGFTTAGRMYQKAYQYNKAPAWVKALLPESYANSAGFIGQSDSLFGGMNPNGFVAMGPQQAGLLASQDEGLFATPGERAAWYAANAQDNGRGTGSSNNATFGGDGKGFGNQTGFDGGSYW